MIILDTMGNHPTIALILIPIGILGACYVFALSVPITWLAAKRYVNVRNDKKRYKRSASR